MLCVREIENESGCFPGPEKTLKETINNEMPPYQICSFRKSAPQRPNNTRT